MAQGLPRGRGGCAWGAGMRVRWRGECVEGRCRVGCGAGGLGV